MLKERENGTYGCFFFVVLCEGVSEKREMRESRSLT